LYCINCSGGIGGSQCPSEVIGLFRLFVVVGRDNTILHSADVDDVVVAAAVAAASLTFDAYANHQGSPVVEEEAVVLVPIQIVEVEVVAVVKNLY